MKTARIAALCAAILSVLAGTSVFVSAASVKPGDLIVSEIAPNGSWGHGAIYAFDPATSALTEIVRSGPDNPIHNPEKMAITGDGKIIVADWWAWDTIANATAPGHDRGIYSIDPATGAITTILQNGPLVTPLGVVIDGSGKLIVIDHGTNAARGQVLQIDPVTRAVLRTSTNDSLWSPQGIVRNKSTGKIFIADHNGWIFSLDESTLALTPIVNLTPGDSRWMVPQDLIVTEDGRLLVATLLGTIYLVDPVTGSYTLIFNDNARYDDVPSNSAFDSLEWIDADTFAVINHGPNANMYAFDFIASGGSVSSPTRLYDNSGGPLLCPLGLERYDVEPVPEPGTLLLLGSGLAGLAGYGRKKLNK